MSPDSSVPVCWITQQKPSGSTTCDAEGDVQRAARVSCALEPARVRQRDGNEQPRDAQIAQQLHAEGHDHGVGHPEHAQQHARSREEQHTERRGARKRDACRDMNGAIGAIRMAGAEVLAGDGRGRAHQSDRRPGDERKELGVRHGIRGLRLRAVRKRADEAEQQHTGHVHHDRLHTRWQPETKQRANDRPSPAAGCRPRGTARPTSRARAPRARRRRRPPSRSRSPSQRQRSRRPESARVHGSTRNSARCSAP